jgi:hypothetical protein
VRHTLAHTSSPAREGGCRQETTGVGPQGADRSQPMRRACPQPAENRRSRVQQGLCPAWRALTRYASTTHSGSCRHSRASIPKRACACALATVRHQVHDKT